MKKAFTLLLLVISTHALATIWYAKPVSTNSGDGSSWSNASNNLSLLLKNAAPGDEIWVAKGTYYPTLDPFGNKSYNNTFFLKDGVKVYGGFSGSGHEEMITDRDIEANPTILSAFTYYSNVDETWSTYATQVVVSSYDGPGTVLDGFTIRDGVGEDGYIVDTDPITVDGVLLEWGDGAGIYLSHSMATIANCTVTANRGVKNGGGIYILHGSPTITFCTIQGNTAWQGGGGICNIGGSPLITNCVISNNSAGPLLIGGSDEALGGGGGGILTKNGGTSNITNCVIANNSANAEGGGLANYGNATSKLTNTVLYGNKASWPFFIGGAIANTEGGQSQLESCTLFGNSAETGSGIYNGEGSSSTTKNSILWSNIYEGLESNLVNEGGGASSFAYSLVGGSGGSSAWLSAFGTDGGGNIDTIPDFKDSTLPRGADGIWATEDDGLALNACSPAVNSGDNTSAPSRDVATNPRPFASITDMGAYETQQAAENCVSTEATRLYVKKGGSGTGTSWEQALGELRDAVAIANERAFIKEIWVAAGNYKPTANLNREASLVISRANVKLLGGFSGTETAASEAQPTTNLTVISGDIGTPGDTRDNSYHLISITGIAPSGADIPIIIDGFYLELGNANKKDQNNTPDVYGGAIIAGEENEGVYPAVRVSRCVFRNNHSDIAGGAIGLYQRGMSIEDSKFENNTSPNGGAIAAYGSSLYITKTVFQKNTASVGNGGVAYFYASNAIFENCAFDQNKAKVYGGAIYHEQSTYPDGLWMLQCVANNNQAQYGGWLYANAPLLIRNSTVFANKASADGGAVYVGATGSLSLAANNIFWKNTKAGSSLIAGADMAGSLAGSINYNLLQAGTAVPANKDNNVVGNLRGVDPLFVNENLPAGADLQFAKGNDGLELSGSSPAINFYQGLNYAPVFETDILGLNRKQCEAMDGGAYEYQGCPPNSLLIVAENSTRAVSANNPFSTQLRLQYKGNKPAPMEIRDPTGKPVYRGTALPAGSTQINTAHWLSGLYQITVYTDGGPSTVKVIKLR